MDMKFGSKFLRKMGLGKEAKPDMPAFRAKIKKVTARGRIGRAEFARFGEDLLEKQPDIQLAEIERLWSAEPRNPKDMFELSLIPEDKLIELTPEDQSMWQAYEEGRQIPPDQIHRYHEAAVERVSGSLARETFANMVTNKLK